MGLTNFSDTSVWIDHVICEQHGKIIFFFHKQTNERLLHLGWYIQSVYPLYAVYPTQKMIWKPTIHYASSPLEYKLLFLLYHYVPAFFIDIALRIGGSKLRLMKIYSKIYYHLQFMEYFMNSTWKFDDTKMQKLYSSMSPDDLSEFPCIERPGESQSHVVHAFNGIRKYFFKETDEELAGARRKYKLLTATHNLFLILFYSAVGYMIYYLTKKYLLQWKLFVLPFWDES